MRTRNPLLFIPLDLDTFAGSERFIAGSRLGAAFSQGMRAYLRAAYADALEHFKAALIAAYVEGEEQAQIYVRERAIIYLYIGNTLVFQNQWAEALHNYLESVQIDQHLAEAHYNLGVTFAALAQFEPAINAFKESLRHNPELYEAHFSLGRCYQHIDDAGRAYIHFQHACSVRPQAAEPRYYLGLMHQEHGARDLAQRCFAEALRVEPGFVEPHFAPELSHHTDSDVVGWYYRLGEDLKNQGYEEESERIYLALLQWRPHEHRARYALGNLLARAKRLDEAMTTFEMIPPDHGHYIDARIRMSTILRIRNDIREAYDVLFGCARLFPNNGALFLAMGKLLYDMGRGPQATRAFHRAVELLPSDPQAHYLYGYMLFMVGDQAGALTAWEKAIALAPQTFSLRFDLGSLHMRRGQYDFAAEQLRAILDAMPDDIEALFLLGVCYKELGNAEQAIHTFEKVLRLNPSHAQAMYHLGSTYVNNGNAALGKAYLRRYDHMTDTSQANQRRTI